MNYEKNYFEYLRYVKKKRKLMKAPVSGFEGHHIIPRCMNGQGKSSDWKHPNIVPLTYREHYLAHYLLMKIYENNYRLMHAFFAMNSINHKYINSRLYEVSRYKLIERLRNDKNRKLAVSKALKGKKHTKERIQRAKENYTDNMRIHARERMLLLWKDEEFQKRMSDKSKQLWKNENYRKRVLNHPNRHKKIVWTDEQKKACSLRQLGEKNPFFGKKHSEVTKRLLQEKRSSGKVLCITTGLVYLSMKEAERKTLIPRYWIKQSIEKQRQNKWRMDFVKL